jgi:hypothetical protein
MNPHQIANLIDLALSACGGILVTLFGFRVLGKQLTPNARYEKLRPHMRWLGPLCIVLALAQYCMTLVAP